MSETDATQAAPGRPRRPGRRERRGGEPAPEPRLLARWQRAVLWVVWLGVVGVMWSYTEHESLQWPEVGAIAAGIGITVWLVKHRAGKPKVVFDDPAKLAGEFASRVNWPMVLVSAGITLGGVAFGVRLVHDLSSGFATWRDVFADTVAFFAEWFTERASSGREGDVTHTRMYVMVVLLPIGAIMLWFNLIPLTWRGTRFRIEPDGSIRVRRDGLWTRLNPRDYARVTADAITIHFTGGERMSRADLSLPQWRVFSVEHDTRVEDRVLGEAIRARLETFGFTLDVTTNRQWTATRDREWV